jgi:hypothetical protein
MLMSVLNYISIPKTKTVVRIPTLETRKYHTYQIVPITFIEMNVQKQY